MRMQRVTDPSDSGVMTTSGRGGDRWFPTGPIVKLPPGRLKVWPPEPADGLDKNPGGVRGFGPICGVPPVRPSERPPGGRATLVPRAFETESCSPDVLKANPHTPEGTVV